MVLPLLTDVEIATYLGISVESVRRWVRQADIDDRAHDGVTHG